MEESYRLRFWTQIKVGSPTDYDVGTLLLANAQQMVAKNPVSLLLGTRRNPFDISTAGDDAQDNQNDDDRRDDEGQDNKNNSIRAQRLHTAT